MTLRERYFDHAATTPLDPRVFAAMRPWMEDEWANAHSLHEGGVRARAAVEAARATVATALGAEDPSQILFTSGATEACNHAIGLRDDWAISPFEHAAVREAGLGFGAAIVPHQGPRLAPVDAPAVAVMAVSNETGTCWDVREVAAPAAFKFVDLTQAIGKTRFDLTSVDAAAISAHKFGGPKGVGALYLADPVVPPFLVGGGQEDGRRGGTLNVPAIVGMGEAIRLASEEWPARAERSAFLTGVVVDELRGLSDVRLVAGEEAVSSILCLMIHGVHGAALVQAVSDAGFAISAGPACSSDSIEPSPGLLAVGLSREQALSCVRISFGPDNTAEAARELARTIRRQTDRLRGMIHG